MNDTEKFVFEVMEDYAGVTDKREQRACVRLLSRRLEAAAALAEAAEAAQPVIEEYQKSYAATSEAIYDETVEYHNQLVKHISTALRQWKKVDDL